MFKTILILFFALISILITETSQAGGIFKVFDDPEKRRCDGLNEVYANSVSQRPIHVSNVEGRKSAVQAQQQFIGSLSHTLEIYQFTYQSLQQLSRQISSSQEQNIRLASILRAAKYVIEQKNTSQKVLLDGLKEILGEINSRNKPLRLQYPKYTLASWTYNIKERLGFAGYADELNEQKQLLATLIETLSVDRDHNISISLDENQNIETHKLLKTISINLFKEIEATKSTLIEAQNNLTQKNAELANAHQAQGHLEAVIANVYAKLCIRR